MWTCLVSFADTNVGAREGEFQSVRTDLPMSGSSESERIRESSSLPSTSSPPTVMTQVSPKKHKLRAKVKKLQQSVRRLKKTQGKFRPQSTGKASTELGKRRLLQALEEFLPPSTHTFVATQIRLAGRKKKGNRWKPKEKALALSLLHSSPKAYRILQKILSLPDVSTLRLAMRKVKIFPGFNENILDALKRKISNMSPDSAACALVFDEMSLKEGLEYNKEEDNIEGLEDFGHQRTHFAANHATVFMVRGLLQPWKQAVGYVLSTGTINGNLLKSLVSKCLEKLTEIGLKIKAVICDQGPNNRKAMEGLGITEDRPYFLHNNSKVYVVYDPPHLVKNTRNNLEKT